MKRNNKPKKSSMKSNVNKNMVILIFVIICIIALFQLKFLIPTILEIFQRNFGEYDTGLFIGTSVSLITVMFLVGLIIWSLGFVNNKKINWWIVSTILLIIYVFAVGMLFIDYAIGTKNIDLVLRDDLNNLRIVGNITCTGNSGVPIAGEYVICDFKPVLLNHSAYVTFKFINKSMRTESIQNLVFVAPQDVEYVNFIIKGIDLQNNLRDFSTGKAHHFPTSIEYEQNRGKLLRYMLALLAIVLFSIPSAMVNFKSLCRDKGCESK